MQMESNKQQLIKSATNPADDPIQKKKISDQIKKIIHRPSTEDHRPKRT